MANEKLNSEILLNVFGQTADSLNCYDANTGISEIFENYMNECPSTLLEMFIINCTIDDFESLKLIATNYEVSTNF